MIDFSKILNKTPAERASDRELHALRIKERLDALVKKRIAQVDTLEANQDMFGAYDLKFISHMIQKRDTYDIYAIKGGDLASLTDSQIGFLDRLCARAKAPAAHVSAASHSRC